MINKKIAYEPKLGVLNNFSKDMLKMKNNAGDISDLDIDDDNFDLQTLPYWMTKVGYNTLTGIDKVTTAYKFEDFMYVDPDAVSFDFLNADMFFAYQLKMETEFAKIGLADREYYEHIYNKAKQTSVLMKFDKNNPKYAYQQELLKGLAKNDKIYECLRELVRQKNYINNFRDSKVFHNKKYDFSIFSEFKAFVNNFFGIEPPDNTNISVWVNCIVAAVQRILNKWMGRVSGFSYPDVKYIIGTFSTVDSVIRNIDPDYIGFMEIKLSMLSNKELGMIQNTVQKLYNPEVTRKVVDAISGKDLSFLNIYKKDAIFSPQLSRFFGIVFPLAYHEKMVMKRLIRQRIFEIITAGYFDASALDRFIEATEIPYYETCYDYLPARSKQSDVTYLGNPYPWAFRRLTESLNKDEREYANAVCDRYFDESFEERIVAEAKEKGKGPILFAFGSGVFSSDAVAYIRKYMPHIPVFGDRVYTTEIEKMMFVTAFYTNIEAALWRAVCDRNIEKDAAIRFITTLTETDINSGLINTEALRWFVENIKRL